MIVRLSHFSSHKLCTSGPGPTPVSPKKSSVDRCYTWKYGKPHSLSSHNLPCQSWVLSRFVAASAEKHCLGQTYFRKPDFGKHTFVLQQRELFLTFTTHQINSLSSNTFILVDTDLILPPLFSFQGGRFKLKQDGNVSSRRYI